jgi:ABC-type glycerol-3-phosphate transport system permease component
MLMPFIYMVSTSLKTMVEASKFPPAWIPDPVVWQNYVQIWREIPLGKVFPNSIKISTFATVGQLFSCSLAGFAFARLNFRGRGLLFTIVLATLMVPFQVTLIPTFLLYRKLGWINTHYPLIVPYWFGGAFAIFLTRQFFLTIPQELVDAAKVDGCNPFRIYWQIFVPLTKPVMATLAIFTFLGSWNNLLLPLVYIRDSELMTFPVALSWLGGYFFVNLPLMMAAAVVSIVPTLVVFLSLQRYFVQGVVLSGLKA